jgi:16S rRNA (cytosine1402-N4)-methyltransferase
MAGEVMALLRPAAGMRFIDGTVGEGGHAELVLEASGPDGRLLGMDVDEEALGRARLRLARFGRRVTLVRENFALARRLLERLGWGPVEGVLLDLGLSSLQLASPERGFSFRLPGPLDMRFDRRGRLRAADLLGRASEADLARLLREFGEEQRAARVARELVAARTRGALRTTADLARAVERALGGRRSRGRGSLHPATRTFQALRIAVNEELENLRRFLADGYELLRPGGRMVILSYHSLEDRMVKRAFRRWAASCLCPPGLAVCVCGWRPKVRLLTPRAVAPTMSETAANPRARSARLRAVERLGDEG